MGKQVRKDFSLYKDDLGEQDEQMGADLRKDWERLSTKGGKGRKTSYKGQKGKKLRYKGKKGKSYPHRERWGN